MRQCLEITTGLIACPNCGNKYLTEIQNVKPSQSPVFDPSQPKGLGKVLKNWNDPRRYIAYWCSRCAVTKNDGWVWDRII